MASVHRAMGQKGDMNDVCKYKWDLQGHNGAWVYPIAFCILTLR